MLPLFHHYLSRSQGCLQFYSLKTWLPESGQAEQNWLTISPIAKFMFGSISSDADRALPLSAFAKALRFAAFHLMSEVAARSS